MPPTEHVIWEAKRKPGSLKGSRRNSTVVDATGCKVTIGFLLPTRSSSRDSSVSSHDAPTPGTPASPLEDATPGFTRPTGSLYHAPEMAVLRSGSESSLHKPAAMGVFQRPPQLGGRSQTFHGRTASCWQVTGASPAPARGLNSSDDLSNLRKSMRRTKSDHNGLISMQAVAAAKADAQRQSDTERSCAIIGSSEAENAIESDSEDDDEGDEFSITCNYLQTSGIAAQRSRPTYAQRRAMSDLRVERQEYLPPLSSMQPVQQVASLVVRTTAQYLSAEYEEAIVETPIEVKSFAYEEILPHRALRPSRSRPTPTKGVLKKAGTRSSSEDSMKHVSTSTRRGSGSVVSGKVVIEPTSRME